MDTACRAVACECGMDADFQFLPRRLVSAKQSEDGSRTQAGQLFTLSAFPPRFPNFNFSSPAHCKTFSTDCVNTGNPLLHGNFSLPPPTTKLQHLATIQARSIGDSVQQ